MRALVLLISAATFLKPSASAVVPTSSSNVTDVNRVADVYEQLTSKNASSFVRNKADGVSPAGHDQRNNGGKVESSGGRKNDVVSAAAAAGDQQGDKKSKSGGQPLCPDGCDCRGTLVKCAKGGWDSLPEGLEDYPVVQL
jgi:hypothetical protein